MKKVLLVCLLVNLNLFAIIPQKNIKPTAKQMQLMDEIRKSYSGGYWAEKFRNRHDQIQKYGSRAIDQILPDTVFAPVLFGKYSDKNEIYTTTQFQQLLFSGPNATGTVTDFYKENSYNQLIMTGECIGWYRLPRTQDYYVKDGGRNAGLSYGGRDFTIDLMVQADKNIDYGKYVSKVDAEGAHVTLLVIYHSGADAASGADNIWSHRWNIRDRLKTRKSSNDTLIDVSRILSNGRYLTNDTLNGLPVIIDGDYCIQPELRGSNNSSGQMKPIGVLAHELGHIFGLPDLYDTDNSSAGVGNWCVMSGGSYGADGRHEETPAQFSAWCKEKLGWVVPKIITTYIPNQQIKYVEKYPEIYKFYPKGNSAGSQYFLVENRQKFGYDKYLFEGGLLIWHIDNSKTSNANENARLVDLEQADGLHQLNTSTVRGDAGDPFPGSSTNRTFDGYSNPNSKDYLNQQTYVGIRKISNKDTIMTASFDVGTRPYLTSIKAELLESDTSNQNGRVDAGEKGNLKLIIENAYPVDLTNANIKITSASNDLLIDTTLNLKINVTGLAVAETTYKNIISVKSNSLSGRKNINVEVSSSEEVFKFTLNVMVGFPQIALLNADTTNSTAVSLKIEQILSNYGKEGELLQSNSNFQTLSLKNRKTLILFSGIKKSNIISEELGDSLINFIKRGGNVFITGQNIAEDFSIRQSTLASRLLKSSFTKNVFLGRTLFGIQSNGMGAILNQITLGGIGAIGNQTSPDELNNNGSMPIFRWNDAEGGGFGGVWWKDQTANGKLLFWSFGIEAIPDSVADLTVTSRKAITTVFNWFDGLVSTPDVSKNNLIPQKLELLNNYPNPFNPTTSIKFGIPLSGKVKIKIYDLLGRMVSLILDEELIAGYHSINFDASKLSSGTYIYKIETSEKSLSKKMMLLK
ncbi:MAG: M6 family metalloprotease domain-containing protein [Bacteroidetes bacterium]|nr:M6 family metalloprotease domain-containing protein [Bacteroidota bacterium]